MLGCGYTILVWELFVCLPREYRHMWRTKFSFLHLNYFLCRYWPLASVPGILYAYTVDHSLETCEKMLRIPAALVTLNQIAAEMILMTRTVAFLGHPYWVMILLPTCLICTLAYQFWVIFSPLVLLPFLPPATSGPCFPMTVNEEILGFFLSSFSFDALTTGLMLWWLFQLRLQEGSFTQSRLVHLFVSEGLWYFILVSTANLVNGILYAQPVKTLSGLMLPFSNMLPNVFACRLILDLREHGSQFDNDWTINGRPVAIFDFLKPRFPAPQASTPPFSTVKFEQPTQPTESGGAISMYVSSSDAGMLVTSRAMGRKGESSTLCDVCGAGLQTTLDNGMETGIVVENTIA
ncbi:hypothetical protein FRB95_001361 [Tulasnella sp. JGI-2019a]|nr:hypothetical protein FRB95_001361 [Tulasnella sp. JGI-2019a]